MHHDEPDIGAEAERTLLDGAGTSASATVASSGSSATLTASSRSATVMTGTFFFTVVPLPVWVVAWKPDTPSAARSQAKGTTAASLQRPLGTTSGGGAALVAD